MSILALFLDDYGIADETSGEASRTAPWPVDVFGQGVFWGLFSILSRHR
jgi:hypothetical protein